MDRDVTHRAQVERLQHTFGARAAQREIGRDIAVAVRVSHNLDSNDAAQGGRNAVQVSHRMPSQLNFEDMARHLETLGEVSYNRFLLKFQAEGHEFTVFPDGRAIIKGTHDVDRARTLYAKYVGH